jgi:orotate phosphoribosyltransferase
MARQEKKRKKDTGGFCMTNLLNVTEIDEILVKSGVWQKNGHFQLTSGRHSDQYLQCAMLSQYPAYFEPIARHLAELFNDLQFDLVLSPALGGIVLGYEVARALGVRALFTERENGIMCLKRSQTFAPGSRILVTEDVLTTGKSVREVIEVATTLGGCVTAVGAIIDRSAGAVQFGVPTRAVRTLEVKSFEASECPMCRTAMPIVKPGSRPNATK